MKWTKKNSIEAIAQCWNIFDSEDGIQLQTRAEREEFATDEEAARYEAKVGKRLALKAIAYLKAEESEDYKLYGFNVFDAQKPTALTLAMFLAAQPEETGVYARSKNHEFALGTAQATLSTVPVLELTAYIDEEDTESELSVESLNTAVDLLSRTDLGQIPIVVRSEWKSACWEVTSIGVQFGHDGLGTSGEDQRLIVLNIRKVRT